MDFVDEMAQDGDVRTARKSSSFDNRCLVFCLLLFGAACDKPAGGSLTSTSKNGTHRVTIVEIRDSPRRFEISLERLRDGFKTNIYRSPHETRGYGTERIVWRDDHSQFVVIGRNLFVNNEPIIPMESMYLLYDLPTGKLWCNSIEGNYRPFSEKDIRAWRGSYENDGWRLYPKGSLPPLKPPDQ